MTAKSLNIVKFNATIDNLVTVIMTHNPEQLYNVSDQMSEAAELLAQNMKPNMDKSVFETVLVYRQNFEKAIKAKYRVRYFTGASAMVQDLQTEYTKKKVIQRTQVKSGFLDTLIGKLASPVQITA